MDLAGAFILDASSFTGGAGADTGASSPPTTADSGSSGFASSGSSVTDCARLTGRRDGRVLDRSVRGVVGLAGSEEVDDSTLLLLSSASCERDAQT